MPQPSPPGKPDPVSPPPLRRRKRRRYQAVALIRSYQKADRKRTIGEVRKSIPGLGVSLALHVAVLMVMAWIVIRNKDDSFAPLELGWSTIVESDAEDPSETEEVIQPIVIPSVSMSKNSDAARITEPVTPQESPAKKASPEESESPALKLANVSNSLSLRNRKSSPDDGEGRGAKKGTGREAIENALRWIVKQQESDGRWRLNGSYADAGTIETDTGATALALLALLGDGHTHQTGDFQQEVRSGLDWLAKIQRPNGDFFDILEEGREAHFYAHSQATIAYCEALALTGDDSLRPIAQRAVTFLEQAQNPALGGWKYRPLNDDGIGDLSVTGWALMALHSARMANLEVDLNSFFIAERFLNSVQEQPSTPQYYKYRPDFPIAPAQRHSMTAEGLLCRQWLGWPKNHLPMRRGVDFLMMEKNLPEWKPYRRNVYAWYYTAQTLHNIGGEKWKQWFEKTLPLLVNGQIRSGPDKGSWHPAKPPGDPYERSSEAGRLYLTVMCVLILETPYRHAPLYGEDTTP